MSSLSVRSGTPLRGRVRVPGDKSISHRALLLGAIAEGESRVSGFLPAADCLATLRCLRGLGVKIETPSPIPSPYAGEGSQGVTLIVHGRGLHGLHPPQGPLDCGGSGTTMRLLSGILAGQPFRSVLTGNAQLSRRPMARVAIPLRQMGARVTDTDGHAPLLIEGGHLRGIDYTLPVASAQVKSAILLAGLYADGPTTVREPVPTRDHTERMLQAMGGGLRIADCGLRIEPGERLQALDIVVPGDFSSAAFLIVAATLVPGSEVTIAGVGVNPTRTGALEVLKAMGAHIEVKNEGDCGGEPVADLRVRAGELSAMEIGGAIIPRLIDELPLLALVATQARGMTVIRDAAELRVKETDRIATTVAELRKLGAQIEARPDGFVVRGPTPLRGAEVDSHGDHRLAMTLAVAGLLAEEETRVHDVECIADSFPGFVETLRRLGGKLKTQNRAC
ncbi:MAG: 3-phosphoshikimate 1-carboxyvinyltransferase [Anaerolineae bacterium]|nr:3-phosphoshikimate 1-carboxyvinyltransferase [Anaerolineae bacterium]